MHRSILSTLCFAAAFLAGSSLMAQEAPKVKVEVKEIKTQEQKTPQFQAGGVKDHAWRPKTWLEIDMALDVKKAKSPTDLTTLVDALEVKYFVGLSATDAAKKPYVLSGTMTVQNVPTKVGEHAHVLAFVSPSTLHRLLGENKQFNAAADITKILVQISYQGQVVYPNPRDTAKQIPADLSKVNVVDGAILPKVKTPFAPLWGDYDVDVKLQ